MVSGILGRNIYAPKCPILGKSMSKALGEPKRLGDSESHLNHLDRSLVPAAAASEAASKK